MSFNESYVLDASVAGKWFLPKAGEPLVEEALEILEGYTSGQITLLVPDLFWPEFGNILWKAVRGERISRQSAEEALSMLADIALPTASSLPLLSNALGMAVTFGRTVYDCIYVALALARNLPLITADERLANALATRFPVRWLGALA